MGCPNKIGAGPASKPALSHKLKKKRENTQKKLAERNNSRPIRYTAPKKRNGN